MATTLTVARQLLLEAAKADSTQFTTTQQDIALAIKLGDFVRRTHCARGNFTLPVAASSYATAMMAGTAPVPADWRRERTISVHVDYNNTGTWNSGTSYNPFDLVVNTGTPDGFAYVCTVANTNQQPPNAAYWSQVTWDGYCPVNLVTEAEVAHWHEGMNIPVPNLNIPRWIVDRGGYGFVATLGVPVLAAFRDDATLVYWPQVSAIFQFYFKYWQLLTTWTWGTVSPSTVTINVPDEYLQRAIVTGCVTQLQMNTPAGRMTGVENQDYEALVKEVLGTVTVDTAIMSRRRAGIFL